MNYIVYHFFVIITIVKGHIYESNVSVTKKYIESSKEHIKPSYNYEYGIRSDGTGDVKGQKERRDGDVVKGEYHVNDPDGFVRTVKYIVDKDKGFQATVIRKKGTHEIVTGYINLEKRRLRKKNKWRKRPIIAEVPQYIPKMNLGEEFREISSPEVVTQEVPSYLPKANLEEEFKALPSIEVEVPYYTASSPLPNKIIDNYKVQMPIKISEDLPVYKPDELVEVMTKMPATNTATEDLMFYDKLRNYDELGQLDKEQEQPDYMESVPTQVPLYNLRDAHPRRFFKRHNMKYTPADSEQEFRIHA